MIDSSLVHVIEFGSVPDAVISMRPLSVTADFGPDGSLIGVEILDTPIGLRFEDESVRQDFAAGATYVRLLDERSTLQETCAARALVGAAGDVWRLEVVAPKASTWLPPS